MTEFIDKSLNSLLKRSKVIGFNQTIKSVEKKLIELVILAVDAEADFKQKVENICREENVKIVNVSSGLKLAEFCKIDVPCAVAGILKQT